MGNASGDQMNARGPLADYLTARRHQLQPEDVGLVRDPGRRVEGLRREEVAALAGISVEYYLRLEQGRDRQPSEQVLSALSRAMLLDADADAYLHRIVQLSAGYRRPTSSNGPADAAVQMMLLHPDLPAYVSDANLDILAVNELATALAPDYLVPGRNLLLDVFEHASTAHDEEWWQLIARRLVAALRYQADSSSARLQELVGSLSVEHRVFRQLWSFQEAHPLVTGDALHAVDGHGWVELHALTLDVPGVAHQQLTTMYADPGSPGEDALATLRARVRPSIAGRPSAARQPAEASPSTSAASSANLTAV